MHLELDSEACQGHGRCYSLAPELFDCDDDGHSVLLCHGEVPGDLAHKAQLAVDNCPEDAIRLV